MRKIGIIGLGHVGRLLAHDLVTTDKVDQLVLIDQDDDLAVGLKADLENAQTALMTRLRSLERCGCFDNSIW